MISEERKAQIRQAVKHYAIVNRIRLNEHRRKYLAKKFGVQRPIETQCALCGKILAEKDLHLDHDHKTGKFRGWLCRSCNTKLGWYERRKDLIGVYLGSC